MMKGFIDVKLLEGRFSTPSEYIRSLIRDDQDLNRNSEAALLIRRGILSGRRDVRSNEEANSRRKK